MRWASGADVSAFVASNRGWLRYTGPVKLNFISRSTIDRFLVALIALLASSCLEPIEPKTASGGGALSTPAATVSQGPREFTHTSAELLATTKLGWNLGNSLDVPEGETAW